MNLDPIKPYLSLIKTVLCVGLLVGAFVTGCSHGEGNKQEEVVTLTAQVESLSDANKEWAKTAEEAQRQVVANKRFAKEQYDRAEGLAKDIGKLHIESQKRQDKSDKQLEAADKEPTCVELLERDLCPLVSLPSRP